MKLLPIFSVLLIAVQMIAAVHLDQLQQPRFVKVRRNLSNDAGSSETELSLKRRNLPEFVSKIKQVAPKFENLGSHRGSQSEVLPDIQHLAGSPRNKGATGIPTNHLPYEHPASMDNWVPSSSISEHFHHAPPSTHPSLAPEAGSAFHGGLLTAHGQKLEIHEQALLLHKGAIDESTADIATHDERLKSVEEALEENKKKIKGVRSGISKKVAWALVTTALAATGTSIYYQRSSSKTIAGMADRIQAQQGEINRLKALNGQQGGAMRGQGVPGGTSDGGLV
ncbi:uncharacterized protein UDID_01021 [Ustilago sp. UG-2017a]|nr:uncharacterized protein UDID_01021 [Ustilago sp. UG-2017a]